MIGYLFQAAAVMDPEKVQTTLTTMQREMRELLGRREPQGPPERNVPDAEELRRLAGYGPEK